MHDHMVGIQYSGDSPVFVEDFKKGCKRSKAGALSLIPRKLIQVSSEELEHLRKNRPDVFKFIKISTKSAPLVEKKDAQPEVSEEKPKEAEDESEKNLKQNVFKKDKKKL